MTGPAAAARLDLIANARLPSQRAQSLQVVQVASAFARAGADTRLLHARRIPTPTLPPGEDLFTHYAVAEGPRPEVVPVPCVDWIDRAPRKLQFLPARAQEWTFARNAARAARRDAVVLSREVESARALVRAGHTRTYLELHRVPGGRLRRRWLVETAPGLAGIVAISGGVRGDLLALGLPADRITVEHDGFEPARFENLPPQRDARALLGLREVGPLVVYTGGLLDWKGVDLLVDAARELPEVRFAVAGGMDDDVARLRARAAGLENVRIDGFQPPTRVGLYLAAGDVGVVPNRSRPAISARYTSPLKVFEAFGAGLPLVASDLPSLRDVLVPDRDAVLVPPDDAAALAAGLRRVLGDPDLLARLRARGLERASAHGWDARARRLLAWMGLDAGTGRGGEA